MPSPSPPAKRPRVNDDATTTTKPTPPPDLVQALNRLAAKLPSRPARAAPLLTQLLTDAALPWGPPLGPHVAGCLYALAAAGDAPDAAKAAARAFAAASARAATLWPSDGDDADTNRATRSALDALGGGASLRWRFATDDSFELARAVADWKAALAEAAATIRQGEDGDADVRAARAGLAAAATAAEERGADDAAGEIEWPPTVAAAAAADRLVAALTFLDTRAATTPWVPASLAGGVAAALADPRLPPLLADAVAALAAAAADRKKGASTAARPTGDGATRFEADAARWRGAAVSARGSVGARGDASSFQVLGGG